MMDSSLASVPAGGKSLYGKSAGDLMEDVRILSTGDVVGTFKYVDDYKDFSSVKAEQKGNFMCLTLGSQYTGKEKSVQRTSNTPGKVTKSTDDDWVLRLTDGTETVYTIKAPEVADLTLKFAHATMQQGQ